MKNETKNNIKQCFKDFTNRDPSPNEEIAMLSDVGLIVPVLIKKVEELEERILKLESK